MRSMKMFYFLWQNIFMFSLLSKLISMFFGKRNLLMTDLTPSAFGLKKLARNHTIHVVLVEGASVITGPKCNKDTICNNIWTQLIDAH